MGLLTNSRIVGALFTALCAGYLYFGLEIPLDFWSEEEPFNARSMPIIYGSAGILCGLLLMIVPSSGFDWSELKPLNWKPAVFILLIALAFAFTIEKMGYVLVSILFIFASLWLLGERRWVAMALTSMLIPVCLWLILDALGIYIDPGDVLRGLTGND